MIDQCTNNESDSRFFIAEGTSLKQALNSLIKTNSNLHTGYYFISVCIVLGFIIENFHSQRLNIETVCYCLLGGLIYAVLNYWRPGDGKLFVGVFSFVGAFLTGIGICSEVGIMVFTFIVIFIYGSFSVFLSIKITELDELTNQMKQEIQKIVGKRLY